MMTRARRSAAVADRSTRPRASRRSTALVIEPLVSATRRPTSPTSIGPLWSRASRITKSEKPSSCERVVASACRTSARCAFIKISHRCVPELSGIEPGPVLAAGPGLEGEPGHLRKDPAQLARVGGVSGGFEPLVHLHAIFSHRTAHHLERGAKVRQLSAGHARDNLHALCSGQLVASQVVAFAAVPG